MTKKLRTWAYNGGRFIMDGQSMPMTHIVLKLREMGCTYSRTTIHKRLTRGVTTSKGLMAPLPQRGCPEKRKAEQKAKRDEMARVIAELDARKAALSPKPPTTPENP